MYKMYLILVLFFNYWSHWKIQISPYWKLKLFLLVIFTTKKQGQEASLNCRGITDLIWLYDWLHWSSQSDVVWCLCPLKLLCCSPINMGLVPLWEGPRELLPSTMWGYSEKTPSVTKQVLTRHQICQHLHLRFGTSRTVR